MGSVTLIEVGDAIKDKLAEHTSLHNPDGTSYVYPPDELTENVPGEPMLQVYPDMAYQDVRSSAGMTTFKSSAGSSPTQARHLAEQHWRIDLYARQRRHIGEDMSKLLPLIDAVDDQLNIALNQPTPFDLTDDDGNKAVKTMEWRWERMTFIYGERGLPYVGARFYLTLRFI